MEKKRIIFLIVLVSLIAGILIWGWIGANYHSAIPEEKTVCDFGLMKLCWLWHTENFMSNQQVQEGVEKLFGNSS